MQIQNKIGIVGFIVCLAVLTPPLQARVYDAFPTPELSSRAAAMELLSDRRGGQGCLSPSAGTRGTIATDPALKSALDRLIRGVASPTERQLDLGAAVRLRYTGYPEFAGRSAAAELVSTVQLALSQARQVVEGRLDLALPAELEIVIQDLGVGLDAYCIADAATASILIDSAHARHPRALRESLVRQVAQVAVAAAGSHASGAWSAAFTEWVVSEVDGAPSLDSLAIASSRMAGLDRGLFDSGAMAAGGQWIWFAFLDQAYGPAAVALSVRELAADGDALAALERSLKRATGETLADAFREFQLWTVLTGERADRHHFSFAAALTPTEFASVSDGLPALSVQTDAPMARWSATQVRLVPDARDGGMGVRFEGEFGSEWEADLLVFDLDGQLRRMEIDLEDGAGSAFLPLENIAEAILLIRRLDGDSELQRYTYAAHREAAYPWVLSATGTRRQARGATIEWETGSEHDLIGFNVLRSRLNGSVENPVNPVWIPALGERDEATLYEFLDRDAVPGIAYRYRIEAITSGGWTAHSPYFVLQSP